MQLKPNTERYPYVLEHREGGVEFIRLNFLETTRGVTAAREFCKMVMPLYRELIKERRGMCSTGKYRRAFVASYVAFKLYLKGTEHVGGGA